MAAQTILQPDVSYSFRSYFELPNDTDEILAEFGYSFERSRLDLPKTTHPIPKITELRQQLEETIPFVTLSSEAAKREILVAPVLSRVAVTCQSLLRIEYSLKVNERLQGTLDYLIQTQQSLIVVEAKRDDLTRGFTQLAVEMIALAMINESLPTIYGAVTMGDLWIFGKLEQSTRRIIRDMSAFTLPDDLEALSQVLVGILTVGKPGNSTT